MSATVFDDLKVDHIEFYVTDVAAATKLLTEGYGLTADSSRNVDGACSVVVVGDAIRIVLTEPLAEDHRMSYLDRHGEGVADIALGVADAAAAFDEAVRRGAGAVSGPVRRDDVVTATVQAFGDVTHTFVQRADEQATEETFQSDAGLFAVDHFAVCLEPETLDSTVRFYETVFDFDMVFSERIVVGSQAMNSKVVRSTSGEVTFTLLEPDRSHDPGQIDEFLDNHCGPGVQHVALSTPDIVASLDLMTSRGVRFLDTPGSYYDLLTSRVSPTAHTLDDLRQLNILVDEDHDGQLFQIFAKSVHPRGTFFFEVIERRGARTFGSGNAKALYEAVEYQGAGEASRSADGTAQL